MKKITNFIVDKRYFILVVFILLSGVSLYLGTKVNINYDIAEYLPDDSETRIGMNIMEDNFEEIKSSSLNVMFKGLEDKEKLEIKEKLEQISNVDSVYYEDTSEYNSDEYTLFIVNVSEVSDSDIAKQVYNDVNETFDDYDIYLSGAIEQANKPVLQTWIVVVAIVFAMIILIIMCDSYVEPFLFLFVIGLAVFLNKGTNIIFSSVSNITDSISAILQMALSMDYSIMLMNRYSQEKEKTDNKVEAMKNALLNAFKSISSSSVTTIVGLLALVFMSFTIGRDLGFVLAKGVLFSLLSIFLCLPALILLFDKLIQKTHKKSLNLKLNGLGKIGYKLRFPIFIIFIGLFIASYLLKDGLGILYTDSETDEVVKHFKETNQMAIIYNNEYEDVVSNYCRSLNNDNVEQVLCYGNTINEKLTYSQLPEKLDELGSNIDIEDYLLKILYFNYYNDNEVKMSLNDFVSFIENNIYTNSEFNTKLNENMKNNISLLHNFTDIDLIYNPRNSSDIASILAFNRETINDLYILYNSDNIELKLKLVDFVNFLNNYVLQNEKYSSLIDQNSKNLINQINPFVNKDIINKNMNALELSSMLGLDIDSVKQLLLLYYNNVEFDNRFSLQEFISGVDYLSKNTNYLSGTDVSSLTNLLAISKNENNYNTTKMNKIYLNNFFNVIDSNLVNTVYVSANLTDDYLMTPQEFVNFTLINFEDYLTIDVKNNLYVLKLVIDDSVSDEKVKYTASELSNLLLLDQNSVNKLYVLISYINNYEFELTPEKFVNLILSNKDNELLASKLDNQTINNLLMLSNIMSSVNNEEYYSAYDLSNFLNIDSGSLKLLYSLYDVVYLNKNITISMNDFINYLLESVVINPNYSSNFDEISINKLKTIQNIMNGTINNVTYNSNELYNILSNLTNDLDNNLVDLIYLYSGSINNYNEEWVLTVEELSHYLNNKILTDNRFVDFIDEQLKNHIKDAEKTVNDAKKLLVSDTYSRMIINTTYELESDETFEFIQSIKENLETEDKEIYVIGDSLVAYDMSGAFTDELNFITILTMVAIFVVVALTFKSLIIPLILVLIIQCAVFLTMWILSMFGGSVYFIALLIVQSILMGATIDYAIVYTSYYKESRESMNVIDSMKNAYNKSIHTILTSASILIIVTLVVGNFASAIAAKICKTLSEGTLCSLILILLVLPAILAVFDRFICKKEKIK